MSAEDKLAAIETVYRYATGVDTRDWALYRSVFADLVRFDFSSYGLEQPVVEMPADDWVAAVKLQFSGLHATQHCMTNPLADIKGDSAAVTMYLRAIHVFDPNDPTAWYTVGGYYNDELVRRDGRWLLCGVKLTVTWQQGDRSIMERAAAKGAAMQVA